MSGLDLVFDLVPPTLLALGGIVVGGFLVLMVVLGALAGPLARHAPADLVEGGRGDWPMTPLTGRDPVRRRAGRGLVVRLAAWAARWPGRLVHHH
jgi:hypothetical protein